MELLLLTGTNIFLMQMVLYIGFKLLNLPIKDEKGNIISLLGVGHDVTARRESDEKLRKLNDELSLQAENLHKLNHELEKQKEQQLEKAIAQGKFEIASEFLHDIGNAMVGLSSHLNRISQNMEKNNLDNLKSLGSFIRSNEVAIGQAIGANKAAALVSITDGIVSTQHDNGISTQ